VELALLNIGPSVPHLLNLHILFIASVHFRSRVCGQFWAKANYLTGLGKAMHLLNSLT